MTSPVLRLSNISKSFGAVRALRAVSFDLAPGEVHALVGENGAGKSTLIKIITGAEQPDSGIIELNRAPVAHLKPGIARALGIAAIYQQPALFPDLSVAENIAFGYEKPQALRRVRWKNRLHRAAELLARIGAQVDPETEVRQLSMPQQQLVEIARALGVGARLLIMDEPTASLTAREVDRFFDLVRDLRSTGISIIYISHRLEEVFRIADRVTVMRDGETVATRLIAPAVQPENQSGVEPKPASEDASKHQLSNDSTALSQSELIRLMIGREVATIFPPAENQPGSCLVSVKKLGCGESKIHAVSFDLRAGEILGFAGLVGAGRTELARVLFGITPADSGTVTLGDTLLDLRSPADAIEAGIAYLPEDRRRHGIILQMAIGANITMGILSRLFPLGWMRFQAEQALAASYMGDLSIKAPSIRTLAGHLSGGNQQKVALARWLAAKPKVLILDEPTQGVDIGAKAEIHKWIRRLTAEGLAVLLISSELPEILSMSDRIAVMREGTIATILERSEVDAQEIMAAALGRTKRGDRE